MLKYAYFGFRKQFSSKCNLMKDMVEKNTILSNMSDR